MMHLPKNACTCLAFLAGPDSYSLASILKDVLGSQYTVLECQYAHIVLSAICHDIG